MHAPQPALQLGQATVQPLKAKSKLRIHPNQEKFVKEKSRRAHTAHAHKAPVEANILRTRLQGFNVSAEAQA